MGLRVTVLGCSGTYATAGNACSGYLVRSDSTAIWVDAGPGTLANLQEHVDLPEIDALILTHEHPDHWLEVPVFRNALKYVVKVEGFRVFGTATTRGLAETICGTLEPTFDWVNISDGARAVVGDIDLRFSETDHPVETLAVRFDHGGRTLGYTADTGPNWSLDALDPECAGFDLALCEATYGPENEGAPGQPHCSARQAADMAAKANVRGLVLTHLMKGTADARRHEARAVFHGPVATAAVHQTYDV